MARTPHTTDITGRMILLGTGTSVGVPVIGCGCDVCHSTNPKNKRTRCSAILGLPEGNLLIDTPPDLRQQLLREQIGVVHSVLYTHEHADHVFGLDDLRLFPFYLDGPVPLYCSDAVEQRIRRSFDYAFNPPANLHKGGVPRLEIRPISAGFLDAGPLNARQPLEILGAAVTPIPLRHGPNLEVLGFRFGNIAYCTDTNAIPPESMKLLADLDVLVLDALQTRPHATHFSVDEAVEVAMQLKPRQTLLTHVCHELEHEAACAMLPDGIDLAYDGQQLPLT